MSRLEEAVLSLREGGVAVLTDEERGESCALVAAAASVTPDAFMVLAAESRGSLALALDGQWADRRQTPANIGGGRAGTRSVPGGLDRTAEFTRERLRFVQSVLTGDASGGDFERFGVSVDRADPHGVLGRASEPEAAVDAVRLAHLLPVALLASVSLPGGVLAKAGSVASFAKRRKLPLFSVQDVIADRLTRETIVEAAASARLPSAYAEEPLQVQAFRSLVDGSEHLAMVRGPLGAEPLVRLHSECLTGDALGSLRCDCGEQLRRSLRMIAENPAGGAVIYLRGQEGRGIGLVNKIRAYALQDLGRDTVQANNDLGFADDLRDYGIGVQILRSIGITRLKLLSNNPRKASALRRYGIEVVENIPIRIGPNPHNAGYLETKRLKMGHDLSSRIGPPPLVRPEPAGPEPLVRSRG